MNKKKKQHSLPYKHYYYPVVLVVLVGLITTGYLSVSHYKNYTDITYSSFCAISKAINCDTVSQSPWSILWGLPVAIWGFWGYLFFGIFLIPVRKQSPEKMVLWNVLLAIGSFYAFASIIFGYISAAKIKSYCILCILTYAINFFLFLYSFLIRQRFDSNTIKTGLRKALNLIANSNPLKFATTTSIASLLILKLFIPTYWTYTFPEPSNTVHSGLTEDWHPWIGAEEPVITIEEFADYQCFQCKKMHFLLRQLVAEHPDKIRLVHRHFPMDHAVNEIVVPTPFHIGSGKMAILAIYAASQDKFWKMNDILFDLGQSKEPFNTKTLAEASGFTAGELSQATQNPKLKLLLRNDIRQGMKHGITGTHSFIIDDTVYSGAIPMNILNNILQ